MTLSPPATDMDAAAAAASELIDDLAALTDEPGRITRLYLSPAHGRAVDLVRARMAEAGLAVSVDAAGTVCGRWEGERPGLPALLLGSHLDSVRDAGRFDGPLGVAVALAVVGRLARSRRQLPFAIEVLAFGDEEGVRFPSTLAGSRALAGIFDESTLRQRDANGITLAEALVAFGCDPAAIPGVARRRGDALGYVEVHIEPGRVLERAGQSLGLVSGISSAARLRFTVEGVSGHAGTQEMSERRDALCGAAEMILAIERIAAGCPGVLATVGDLAASPGAVNVIPGRVGFPLDIRSETASRRDGALAAIHAECRAIAARRGLRVTSETVHDEPATLCDPTLKGRLAEALVRAGLEPIEIASGAGHDGLAIAHLCPMAMLFVRSEGGLIHHPGEQVRGSDIRAACAVLDDFVTYFKAV